MISMKKRLFALVSLLLCTVLLCLPAAAAETEGPALTPSPGPVRVWGTLTHLEDGGLLVENSSTEALNSVILHGEDILCLDAVTGEPMELSELKDGETVYAWVGPVMTLSLPPQATAILILANIPADYGVPQYYEISAVTPQAMIAIYPPPALTWTEVTTSDGATIKITDQAELTAFSEDTTVRLEDLVPGTRMLVWTNQKGEPSRVLVFPYAYRGYISCAEDGLLTVSGKVLTEKAIVSGGETLLPLRAVAEALDLKVFWDAKTGANVALADGTKLLSVDPGHGTIVCGDGSELSAASIMQNGTTYVSASTLISQLNLFVAS